MIVTQCDGVSFYEDFPSELFKGQKISTQIDGFFRNSQTSSLRDVKEAMAAYCKSNGGNAIVGFTYGQRSLGFFSSMLSRDNIVWYGEGYIASPQVL